MNHRNSHRIRAKNQELAIKKIVLVQIILGAAVLTSYFMLLYRTAWLSDDAFITFRTVDNFVHGYGLRWNMDERVQSFTHPLWLFLVTLLYAADKNIYYSPIILSFLTSLMTVGMLVYAKRDEKLNVIAVVLCAFLSHAFLDYSTSGLENPLMHCIVVAFILVYFRGVWDRKTVFILSLLASLGMLTRQDSILIFLPCLIHTVYKCPRDRKSIFLLVSGMAPIIAWSLFALFYYGSPFPNNAYAKLGTGISRSELAWSGVLYLWNSLKWDPLTLAVIAAVSLAAVATRCARFLAVALGISLYLAYIVWIGGDFMSGRFLSMPFAAGMVLALYLPFRPRKLSYFALIAGILILGLWKPNPSIFEFNTTPFKRQAIIDSSPHIISNEQLWCFADTALRNPDARIKAMARKYRQRWEVPTIEKPSSVTISDMSGFICFFAGPSVHFVDIYALSDPLLAHLPTIFNPLWRIGHFTRNIPEGYMKTLESGENKLANKSLAEYYEHIELITRGPLFSPQRCFDILKFNLGAYNSLIDKDYSRFPQLSAKVSFDELKNACPCPIPAGGIRISMNAIAHSASISTVISGSPYCMLLMNDDEIVGMLPPVDNGILKKLVETRQDSSPANLLAIYYSAIQQCFRIPSQSEDTFAILPAVSRRGFDEIIILFVSYDKPNTLITLKAVNN